MSFADLKKKSRLGSLTEKLVKEVEKGTGSKTVDERFWKPEMGKGGTGSAVIRFLPAIEGEDVPWVKLFNHAFQDVGGWYIENSLTSSMSIVLKVVEAVISLNSITLKPDSPNHEILGLLKRRISTTLAST